MSKENGEGKIRVGVVGLYRGLTFVNNSEATGMELVAICDIIEDRLSEVKTKHNIATYTDFDEFIKHDMDAVVLANFFHQHAPMAIKALNRGLHVMSETTACKTIAEGVELARAVERSGKIYMLAENYVYFSYIQEMERLYREGEVGEVMYAEGEYIHPQPVYNHVKLAPGLNHWRGSIPSTYYITHALGPLMYITKARPKSVNAQCIPYPDSLCKMPKDPKAEMSRGVRRNDAASVVLLKMDNNAVIRTLGVTLHGHGNWYRVHGTKGLMENLRSGKSNSLRIVKDKWDENGIWLEGVGERIYTPDFPHHSAEARHAGHYGSDFYTSYYFEKAIRENVQPALNLYFGLDMSMAAIQSYRSALENGKPFDIPDLSDENVRKQYENDNWSPFPEDQSPEQPWSSVRGEIIPDKDAVEYAKRIWERDGFNEKLVQN